MNNRSLSVAALKFLPFILFFMIPSLSLCETGGQRNVLLLNSYHQRMTWVSEITRAVEDVLLPEENSIALHIENMDTKRFFSDEYLETLFETYRVKYRDVRFDLIFCSDNHAFDFLLKYKARLFAGVPVCFSGVSDFRDEVIRGQGKVTGVVESPSDIETLELALKLHPGTKRVYIINDYLKTGRAWVRSIRRNTRLLAKRVDLEFSENLLLEEQLSRIRGLPEDSIVLLGGYFTDRSGWEGYSYEKIGAMLSGSSKVPFYCLLGFNVGGGTIGGKVISGYYQGKMMAEMGKRILEGADPLAIPVVKQGVNRFMFDYSGLKRFHIPENALPSGSIIVGRPFSVYRAYRGVIWGVIAFISLLIAGISLLMVNNRKRVLAEGSLRKSEERFRQLAENIKDVFWIGTPDFRTILYISPAYEEVWGRSSSSLYENPESWMDAIIVDDRKKVMECIAEGGRTELVFPKYRIVRPDGAVRWIQAHGYPLKDSGGKTYRIVGVARDITLQRLVEEKYRELVENAQSIMLRWNVEGEILFLNEYGQRLFGYKEKEIRGRNMIGTIVPETESSGRDLAALIGEIAKDTRKYRMHENENMDRNGRRLWISWVNRPLFRGEGVHPEILSVGIDSTERKLAQDRLKRLNEELEDRVEKRTGELRNSLRTLKEAQEKLVEAEKMASLGGLVAGVAHEISTPVGIGVTSISFIEERTRMIEELYRNGSFTRSDLEKYIDLVKESSGGALENLMRAAALVENFKQVAVDQTTGEKRRFNLKEYLEWALLSLAPCYRKTRHTIQVRGDDSIVLYSYPGVFMQILTHLVTNSLAHGFEEMEEGSITVDLFRQEEMILFQYHDDGRGMGEAVRKKIFEPFFTTKRGRGGSGLGMHIVYNHVTRTLGGTIECRSEPGKGTTFTILMPEEKVTPLTR